MTLIESVILGLIQGLTEFLPVSSSGHLVFAERILKIKTDDVVFIVIVHLGTLVAVVYFYRQKLWDIFRAIFTSIFRRRKDQVSKSNLLLAWYLILGTLPAVIFGLAFKDWLEKSFGSPRWTSVEFIVTGLILILTIWAVDKSRTIRARESIAIGIAQAIAIIPAISRSGSTIATGMFLGVSKEQAAEFSFLLSIPAIGGAVILEMPKIIHLIPDIPVLMIYFVGMIVSGVVGFFSIKFLLDVLKRGKFYYFGIYCIALGILGLLFL